MTLGEMLVKQKAEIVQLAHRLNLHHAHDTALLAQNAVVAIDVLIDGISELGLDEASTAGQIL